MLGFRIGPSEFVTGVRFNLPEEDQKLRGLGYWMQLYPFYKGDPSDTMFSILKGKVKAHVVSQKGARVQPKDVGPL